MRDYVIINGVNSLTINGLAISKLPPISKPLMRNMKEEIDGRDGDIITELGYSAYDKTMEIGLYGNFDINEVISFFNGEGTITFSNESDKHYYFKILEQIDYEKLLKFKTATITFHCQPFKYPNNEQIIDVDSLTVEGTGTDITLANTSLYAPINTELLGDTTQDGTPTPDAPINVDTVEGEQTISVKGKNLINLKDVSNTLNGLTGTISGNTITINGTNTKTDANWVLVGTGVNLGNSKFPNFKAGETYTLSVSENTKAYMQINYYKGTTTTQASLVFLNLESTKYSTFTVPNDFGGVAQFFVGIIRTASNIDTTINIQIEHGTVATSYEEYQEQSYKINLGKNLLANNLNMMIANNPSATWNNNVATINGLTFTYNLDGSIKVEGTATATTNFYISRTGTNYTSFSLERGTYYISSHETTGESSTWKMQLNIGGTLYNIYGTGSSAEREAIISSISNVSCSIIVYSGYNPNGAIFYPMISKISNASYAPYKTPIELCKIGDYKDIIFKSKGNQLYDKDNINLIDSYYVDGTGKIVFGSNNKFNWVQLEPNKTYTLSQPIKSNVSVRIALFNSEPIPDSTGMIIGTFTGTTPIIQTFTTTSTSYYLGWVYCNTSQLGNYTQQQMLDSIMLNEGTSVLQYEPYGTNGKWLLHEEIGKIVLNGTENINYRSGGRFDIEIPSNNGTYAILGLCNYYLYTNNWDTHTNTNGTFSIQNINWGANKCRMSFKNTNYSSLSDVQAGLSLNNVIIYFQITSNIGVPTTTEITDTELLAQLTLLSNATTYDETTNIFSNGDLPSILKVSATSIPTTTITNIGNIYAKPLLTIRGSGDISVYLNGIQLLQIALGDREEITIDISKMEAYDEATKVLLNRLVIGDYSKFLINSGVNELLITGDVSNFTMSNYTRWL